jgi:hypothetical protein
MGLHVIQRGSDDEALSFCKRWLATADRLREHLHDGGEGFDPFRYNETATVGFLVAAAGRARMLALPEFTEDCENLPAGRVRAGRCDLWLASEDWRINWLMEFKQCWYGPRSRRGLVTSLNDAIKCAVDRDKREADVRWAVTVYCPFDKWYEQDERARAAWASANAITDLATHVDLAFRFDGTPGPTYMLLKRLPGGARSVERHQLCPNILER